MIITHFDNDDAYEIIISDDPQRPRTITILRFRSCMDGRGEEVNFDDLHVALQRGIKDTLKKALEHQKQMEDEH